jgi:nuclear migration protein JNM1
MQASPLPPPLLPLITRLNNQLQILTQPRHIDSISRRLKLLLSDLDRATAAQHRDNSRSHRRHPSQNQEEPSVSPVADQLLPLLNRLSPSLPHIPHILTRLRTLSALHASAGEFQSSLELLEEDQKRMHERLEELKDAVETVESSMQENRGLVNRNVSGLEERLGGLLARLQLLSR